MARFLDRPTMLQNLKKHSHVEKENKMIRISSERNLKLTLGLERKSLVSCITKKAVGGLELFALFYKNYCVFFYEVTSKKFVLEVNQTVNQNVSHSDIISHAGRVTHLPVVHTGECQRKPDFPGTQRI